MDSDGSDARPITHSHGQGVVYNAPAWSPDGKRIVFDSRRGGDWDIFVMDADGSNERQLTRSEGVNSRPAWSRDGKRIAFHSTRDRPTGNERMDFEVYVMDADGSHVRRLTSNTAFDGHPDW